MHYYNEGNDYLNTLKKLNVSVRLAVSSFLTQLRIA